MIRFVDRDDELSILNRAWDSDSSQFIVLYGRRRIGKTTLLDQFFKDKSGIFYISQDAYFRIQITEIKNYIAEYLNDKFLRKTDIEDWSDLFDYLEKVLDSNKRFFIVLDEFTYLVKNDRSILTKLQRFWDRFLSRTNIMLVICGSDFGMINDTVLSYSSPLYGRRTRDILLGPLDLNNSLKFTAMPFEDALMLYMTIGGIPEYLNRAQDYRDYFSFIMREFGQKQGYFYREPYFLLSQEFRNYNVYFSILNAVSTGKNKPSEIANFIGFPTKNIYVYLENLIRLGFLTKTTPLFDKKNNGHYDLSDRMMDFWFNYVYDHRENIERNSETFGFDFSRYFGKRFESLVRDQVIGKLYPGSQIGSWWYRDTEIDIIAYTPKKNKAIICECKWKNDVSPLQIYSEMKKKEEVLLEYKNIEIAGYHIFAKSFKDFTQTDNIVIHDLPDIRNIVTGNIA